MLLLSLTNVEGPDGSHMKNITLYCISLTLFYGYLYVSGTVTQRFALPFNSPTHNRELLVNVSGGRTGPMSVAQMASSAFFFLSHFFYSSLCAYVYVCVRVLWPANGP